LLWTRFVPARWDLRNVLPVGREGGLSKTLEALEAKTKSFEAVRGRLDFFSARDVVDALAAYGAVVEGISRISAYSYMEYTADTADQKAKARLDKAEDLEVEIKNRTLFFRLWWTGLEDKRIEELMPGDGDDRYVLVTWRKLKPYTLGETVEQVINVKNTTGFSSWVHHYDKITSDFVFTVKVRGKALKDEKGRPRKMVADEVARLFVSPDAPTREAAYRTLLAKYAENGGVLGEIYRTVVRDWRNENVILRGYKSPIASRNLENDVPDEAVSTLLKVCRKNAPVFQDFFSMKAKLLGTKKMSRYHIYAPLERKEKLVTYGKAVRTVLDAYKAFDRKVAALALKVFETGHVDSSPRRGKRSGAYCMSVTPDVIPYLFLNFSGTTRDVYTMAHESGHAVHSQLASSHSMLAFQPPLVLAETASVFGEMILFDRMIRDETDEEVKRSVLLDKISSMYGTIGRQAHFVLFESAAHEAVNSGATTEDLCATYLANLRGQFGTTVEVPEEFRWEWTYIPHIYHTPFYCYAYAFGNLLSLALYDRYTKEGRSFVRNYLKILSYGGSVSPADILQEVGFDLRSEGFWQSGFDVIERLVSQLRRL
jgi:oligoendopeptidase F